VGRELPGNPFYQTPEWRALRLACLKRDGYRCVVCHTSVVGKGQARVDHIKRISDGGAPLELSNVRTLCVLHDNQSHREKAGGGGQRVERFVIKGCDAQGWPLDPNHPWRQRS
jgi:5-methylcytosine-specific restriction endonuclease McrA